MGKTSIEWATHVWNPVVGCSPVSAGCKNCYAKRIYQRFHPGQQFSDVHCIPGRLDEPLHWTTPRRVFVSSMSDLFHPDVPDQFITDILSVILEAPQHKFMVLTKRPERMLKYARIMELVNEPRKMWPIKNLWLGVSVEDQRAADERVPLLLQTPAAVHFVSVEPMLGPVNLRPAEIGQWPDMKDAWLPNKEEYDDWKFWMHKWHGIQWVICGGESGPKARPLHPDWVRGLRDQCQEAKVPFFFKQWGEWIPRLEIAEFNQLGWQVRPEWREVVYGKEWGCLNASGQYQKETTTWNGRQGDPQDDYEVTVHRVGKKAAGRLLDGKEWNEIPGSEQ